MKVIINEIEFELRETDPFSFANPLILYIKNDSVDEIVEAIGEKASVTIPDEYVGTDLLLDSIKRFSGSRGYICEVTFKKIPIDDIVNEHSKSIVEQSTDIESIAQAIEEIGQIIGDQIEALNSSLEDIEAISQAIEELGEIVSQTPEVE